MIRSTRTEATDDERDVATDTLMDLVALLVRGPADMGAGLTPSAALKLIGDALAVVGDSDDEEIYEACQPTYTAEG